MMVLDIRKIPITNPNQLEKIENDLPKACWSLLVKILSNFPPNNYTCQEPSVLHHIEFTVQSIHHCPEAIKTVRCLMGIKVCGSGFLLGPTFFRKACLRAYGHHHVVPTQPPYLMEKNYRI